MCQSPQVLKDDKLSSLSRGHVRWWALAQDAGPCATLALRQRRLHLVGGALKCPQVAHYRKELNPSVKPLVVPVCGGCPHSSTPQEGVPVPGLPHQII